MTYYIGFGLLSAALGGLFCVVLYNLTGWDPYAVWLTGWSGTTFVIYGLDKGLAIVKALRVPELILNLLALLGGFLGGWLGMLAFRHKSNWRRHPNIWLVLVLSTAGHAVLIYLWFFRGG